MNEKDYKTVYSTEEVKNTAPAVMSDRGPRNTTRWKSKDGKYTAGQTVEQEDEYKDEHRSLIKGFNTLIGGNDDTGLLDKAISDKLFRATIGDVFVQLLKKDLQPDEEVFFINSNKYNDIQLGIDYQIGIRTKDRKGFRKINDIDLKTITASLGNNSVFKNPEISLNLYQTRVDKQGIIKGWGTGSFLNENHQNSHYAFIVPQCSESSQSIILRLKQDPNYRPTIYHAKTYSVKRDRLQQYVGERILANENLKTLFEAYKTNQGDDFFDDKEKNPLYAYTKKLGEDNYVVALPVPGEDFNCKIFFQNAYNFNRQQKNIVLRLPFTPLERGTIRSSCFFSF